MLPTSAEPRAMARDLRQAIGKAPSIVHATANYDWLAEQAEGRLTAHRSSPDKEAG